ncbi:hypothetical protein D3C78_1276390 [compost metagenome]
MAHRGHHTPAGGLHGRQPVLLDRLTQRIVHREKKPVARARLGHCRGLRPRRGIGVPGVADGIARAVFVGQAHGACARDDQQLLLFARDAGDRDGNGGVDHVHDHVHLLLVIPLACFAGADVGLVLVVGKHHVDGEFRLGLGLEVIDRHLGGDHRAFARQFGKNPVHIGQHPDLDHTAGDLRGRRGRSHWKEGRSSSGQQKRTDKTAR